MTSLAHDNLKKAKPQVMGIEVDTVKLVANIVYSKNKLFYHFPKTGEGKYLGITIFCK